MVLVKLTHPEKIWVARDVGLSPRPLRRTRQDVILLGQVSRLCFLGGTTVLTLQCREAEAACWYEVEISYRHTMAQRASIRMVSTFASTHFSETAPDFVEDMRKYRETLT